MYMMSNFNVFELHFVRVNFEFALCFNWRLDEAGKAPGSEEAIINAAKVANAHDFIMALDNGYDPSFIAHIHWAPLWTLIRVAHLKSGLSFVQEICFFRHVTAKS